MCGKMGYHCQTVESASYCISFVHLIDRTCLRPKRWVSRIVHKAWIGSKNLGFCNRTTLRVPAWHLNGGGALFAERSSARSPGVAEPARQGGQVDCCCSWALPPSLRTPPAALHRSKQAPRQVGQVPATFEAFQAKPGGRREVSLWRSKDGGWRATMMMVVCEALVWGNLSAWVITQCLLLPDSLLPAQSQWSLQSGRRKRKHSGGKKRSTPREAAETKLLRAVFRSLRTRWPAVEGALHCRLRLFFLWGAPIWPWPGAQLSWARYLASVDDFDTRDNSWACWQVIPVTQRLLFETAEDVIVRQWKWSERKKSCLKREGTVVRT